jgi:colanic acid biosynthesis glycosyl transferase WcaI
MMLPPKRDARDSSLSVTNASPWGPESPLEGLRLVEDSVSLAIPPCTDCDGSGEDGRSENVQAETGATSEVVADSDIRPADASLRILIVGINYAPERTGIAPYTTQAAEHFAALGHDVRVITGVEHYPSWTVPSDMRFSGRRVEVRNGVHVHRLRHHVPSKQSALRRGAYEATFAAQAARELPRWPADVVIAVIPSLLSALVAQRHAKRVGAKFGVWVQDLMGRAAEQSGIAGGNLIARRTAAIEKRVLGAADRVAIVSEGFRPHVLVAGVSEEKIQYLPNWSRLQRPTRDWLAMRTRLGWPLGTVVALHSGNMGLKQALENVVEAGRLADEHPDEPPVRFVLMGDGSQREKLASMCAGATSVAVMAPAAGDEYPDVLAAADVLLVNERSGVRDMSLPSKLTSYFVAGRPVIAATEPTSTTAGEIRRAGAGWVVPPEDPQALLDAVRSVSKEAGRARDAGRRGEAYAISHLGQVAGLERVSALLNELSGSSIPSSRTYAEAKLAE